MPAWIRPDLWGSESQVVRLSISSTDPCYKHPGMWAYIKDSVGKAVEKAPAMLGSPRF